MKVRMNITIEEEARDLLGDRPSQTIEDLILDRGRDDNSLVNEIKFQADRIIEELKSNTVVSKNSSVPQAKEVVIPDPIMGEQFEWDEVVNPTNIITIPACCLKKSPCKHWQWNSDKEGYVNSISGEFREVVI